MKNKKAIIKGFTIFALLIIVFTSCKKDRNNGDKIDSFLPMQVGNYWGTANKQNSYTEIQDSVLINNKLYYKFYSLVGGDGISISYLRIDEQNRLIESHPNSTNKIYVRADFNANLGDIFYTLSDQTVNDYKVTVTSKTAIEMSFTFEMVYHPNLKGQTHVVKYIKGRGWAENFEKIIINGKAYK